MTEIDTRLAFLFVWGGGTVLTYTIVLLQRVRNWRHHRYDRRSSERAQSIRDVVSGFALFLAALGAAASIMFLLFGEAGSGPRVAAVALALGAFFGAGLVMASEEREETK
jgi:uncharacterized membrane protein YbhN (UPF0104 family)